MPVTPTTDHTSTAGQIAAFVECVFDPDDIIEVRRLPRPRSTWHRASELGDLTESLLADNAQDNIYVGANPRKARGGTTDADVSIARTIFADFDKTTVEDAQTRWLDLGLPDPTLIVNSGHGVHAYWRLTESIDPKTFTCWQRDLAAALGSDRVVKNPSRIMRLPGFTNHKQPVALCCVVSADPLRVCELADLHECIPELTDDQSPTATTTESQTANNGSAGLDVMSRAAAYLNKTPGAVEGEHGDDLTFSVACTLLNDFNLSVDQAWPLLWKWNEQCTPPWSEKELRTKLSNAAKYAKKLPGCKANKQAVERNTASRPHSSCTPQRFEPFPVHALPAMVRRFVVEGSTAIGCVPAFVALPVLAVLASAIGTTRRIRLKRTWAEPSVIWAVVVARSGTLKSPAMDLPLEPVHRRQREALREHKEVIKEYDEWKLHYECELAVWKRNKGAGTPPKKQEPPVCIRCVCADATIEALSSLLEGTPRGLLLARDELAGWIGGFDAYKGKKGPGGDSAHWLEMHRAGHLLVDRKTGDRRTISVPRAAVSICGTIQPGTLSDVLGREHFENGLAARLLLAMPPRRPKKWTDAELSENARVGFESIYFGLLDLKHRDDIEETTPVDVPLTLDGQEAWVQFYDAYAKEQDAVQDDDLAAAFAKLEGYAARLALIFHFVRLMEGDTTLADPGAVDVASIEAGVSVARWFCKETSRVYAILSEGVEERGQRGLLRWISQHGGSVTVRELQQGHRQYKTADAAKAALDVLIEAGKGKWTEVQPGESGGRPTKRFKIVYAVYTNETPSDGIASKGFVDVDSVDVSENNHSAGGGNG